MIIVTSKPRSHKWTLYFIYGLIFYTFYISTMRGTCTINHIVFTWLSLSDAGYKL
jgi:hypothetical protein